MKKMAIEFRFMQYYAFLLVIVNSKLNQQLD